MLMTARRVGSVTRKSFVDGRGYPWTEERLIDQVTDASLLCVDDCGTRTDSEAQQQAFLELLNCRDGKPLILTGNHEPTQLHKVFDSRIASRMLSGVVLRLEGDDRRMAAVRVINVKT